MKNYLFLIFGFLIPSCTNEAFKLHNSDNFVYSVTYESENCQIYQQVFYAGSNLFRFAESGSCSELDQFDYLEAYSEFMNRNDSLIKKRGIMVFEFYPFVDTNNIVLDSIISITQSAFETKISIKEMRNNGFILETAD